MESEMRESVEVLQGCSWTDVPNAPTRFPPGPAWPLLLFHPLGIVFNGKNTN